jgi:toxin-antitoxin system PIN domain toxin
VTLPDINLLIHAYNAESPVHHAARAWWETLLNGTRPVGLTWVAMLGFIRIATHRQVLANPMPVATACGHVRKWLGQPAVTVLDPGTRHAEIVLGLLESLGTAGNLTTDAHLAALAIEHQAELHSTDADFARFPGLRWINPIADAQR